MWNAIANLNWIFVSDQATKGISLAKIWDCHLCSSRWMKCYQDCGFQFSQIETLKFQTHAAKEGVWLNLNGGTVMRCFCTHRSPNIMLGQVLIPKTCYCIETIYCSLLVQMARMETWKKSYFFQVLKLWKTSPSCLLLGHLNKMIQFPSPPVSWKWVHQLGK